MTCHIRVNNLALTYRWKNFQKPIFLNLNLCIPSGAFVTLIGKNGCGKSSLVKLILGLAEPQAGEILINEELVLPGYPDAIRQHRIAYLSQQIEDLFFSETLAEELSYQGTTGADAGISDALETLGLADLTDRSVESLSGGERQSLALAQFMMSAAPLLILDEPSSYLDQEKAAILRNFLEQTHHSGKTILHVTQFASEVRWGTHVLDLDKSQIRLTSL
ncbi:MAG: energy-coupling factor ABC transporter ATP-binding protein [Candidatus Marinimicrobia bacterium]|nr:energy-coupling factor ABC transporter ATP-binding protein [Candidatus Neomarinimicrobiota bacterium]MCF7923077.1 energy-coupling factor ABC transporter ATP-binding protein [Candidatus Neomarinimicrobiota bacterium]